MTEFVDRRTEEEKRNGLATQILFWYDKDSKKRVRTNGITITAEGTLVVARSTCSRKDQFVRAMGRLKVSNRIFGRAQKHCWAIPLDLASADLPQAVAAAFSLVFPDDEMGVKRAYNIGKVFARARAVNSAQSY
jgi:hypothetical protein